jgi:catechol 2,3-dioxygenase-like lactoylglutathione lyase family enzyme
MSKSPDPPLMQLAAVRIFVDELALARDFYRDVLGLELDYDGSDFGFCKFASGGIQIILESVAPASEDRALVGRFLGLSFAVSDIEREFVTLSARGVKFTGSPELQNWGGALATLQDPSGNQLQIVQYPAS